MAEILHRSTQVLTPVNGSVVCCGIFGALTHSGIWVNGGIIELSGSGLVRSVSPQRFIHDRSGEQIYVMANQHAEVLGADTAADFAQARIFEYLNYDVFNNNCHRFIANCYQFSDCHEVMLFADLTKKLASYFSQPVVFYPMRS
jgi:hypothetical protein